MDAAEIEVYRQKLGEVELALSADPENSELQQLKGEIEDLLSLSAQLLPESPQERAAPAAKEERAAPAGAAQEWRVGDSCEARYTDGKFYAARVAAVRAGGVYQVAFVKYGTVLDASADGLRAAGGGKGPRAGKVGKRPAGKTRGAGAAATGQQSWLKFAKGGKKLKAKAINDRSIFKSPDPRPTKP
ncbi:hypothetical protein H4R21_000890 [Coemansia helicoidea]|uniref:Uncharacterized protein n=1 Tax=Coemansia helicoidea TaxID=1286919 RepID=A0ACC1LEA9_9FUNG|nr:hypothetical protein H4R21_000890 [Coemansia helicoidea]